MKGVVFNVLEDFTNQNFGDDEFDKIVELSDLETKDPFVGPGTYPDGDLFKIVGKIVELKNLKVDWAIREFGKFLFPCLVQIAPKYAEESDGIIDFLQRVDSIIHIEVKKLFKDAVTPEFTYSEVTETSMKIKYKSNRHLCYLMEGLLDGAGTYFKEPITYKQLECHHDLGCGHCLFEIEKV